MMTRRTYPNLRAYFDETGTTQAAFAARLGMTQAAISKITNGKEAPRLELALRISRAARVPLESLLRTHDRTPDGNTCV